MYNKRPFDERSGHDFRGAPRPDGRDRDRDRDREVEEVGFTELVIKLGDGTGHASENVTEQLATALSDNEARENTTGLIRTLISACSELPWKAPLYGTLIGLINCREDVFGGQMVKAIGLAFQAALDCADVPRAKLLLRTMCELCNAAVVISGALLRVLYSLVDSSISGLEANPEDQRRFDTYTYLVLSVLPWAGRELHETKRAELDMLLTKIRRFLDLRAIACPARALSCFISQNQESDLLNHLWDVIDQLRADDWHVRSIPRIFANFVGRLGIGMQHNWDEIVVPEPSPSRKYPALRSVFRPFPPEYATAPPEARPIDRYILDEYVADTLHFFNQSHKECTKRLAELPIRFRADAWMVESLVSLLFQLPSTEYPLLYYFAMTANICKINEAVKPPMIVAVISMISRLDDMDIECLDRFVDWFAYLQSQLDFSFAWPELSASVDWTIITARQRYFFTELLLKMRRLSYYDRVKKAIPENMHFLLAPKPLPTPRFAPSATTPLAEPARAIEAKMRAKESSDALRAWLEEDENLLQEEKIELIMHSVLLIGSKSFSHLLASLERYHVLLRSYINTPAMRVLCLRFVFDFWALSAQHMVVCLDRFMTYRVVDSSSIIFWIFSAENAPNMSRQFTWEILHNTIAKTTARIQTMEAAVTKALASQESGNAELARAALEVAQKEQKEVFLTTLGRVVELLTEQLNAPLPDTFLISYTLGHLTEIARRYADRLPASTIDAVIMTQQTDPRIVAAHRAGALAAR